MTQMTSIDVPSMGRRQFMNLLTFGTVTGVALGALYPVAQYFTPMRAEEEEEVQPRKMN